jgi:hypothetical protein
LLLHQYKDRQLEQLLTLNNNNKIQRCFGAASINLIYTI